MICYNRKTICFLSQNCFWFYLFVRTINVTFKDVIIQTIQMVFRLESIFRTNIITLERLLPAVFDFHLLRTVFACGKKKFCYKGSMQYLYLKSISSISFPDGVGRTLTGEYKTESSDNWALNWNFGRKYSQDPSSNISLSSLR